jgi:biotin transporter BioY
VQSLVGSRNRGRVHRIKRNSIVAQLILVALGVELFIFASFTAFDLPTATAHNLNGFLIERIQILVSHCPPTLQERLLNACPRLAEPVRDTRYATYVPEAPIAIFVGYVLGWPLGAIAATIFVLIGLLGPYFTFHTLAAGGGPDYYLQASFGYLIGIVLCTSVVGLLLSERRTSVSQALSLALGLFSLHFVGLVYMLGLCLFFAVFDESRVSPAWAPWLFEQARNLTWYSLPYDVLLGLIFIGLGYPFRWLTATLVAPDIGFKSKSVEEDNLVSV